MGLFNTISAVDDDSCPFPAVSFVRRRLARDVDIFIVGIVKKRGSLTSVRGHFFALLLQYSVGVVTVPSSTHSRTAPYLCKCLIAAINLLSR